MCGGLLYKSQRYAAADVYSRGIRVIIFRLNVNQILANLIYNVERGEQEEEEGKKNDKE